MAAVEGSLEEEALKRRERLKAMRKKSGLPNEQVCEVYNNVCFIFSFIYKIFQTYVLVVIQMSMAFWIERKVHAEILPSLSIECNKVII